MQLDEIRQEKEMKWSFNFERETFLPTSSTSEYQFIAVDPATVPSFYHMKVGLKYNRTVIIRISTKSASTIFF